MNDKLSAAFRGESVYLIAEVGTNHGCSLEQALVLIDECAAAGASAVKFQSWNVDEFQHPFDAESGWTQPSPVFELLRRYQAPDEWHPALAARCAERGVEFLSTPFDGERARFLAALCVPAIKISSSDLTNLELLRTVSALRIPVLLSTGMGDEAEIARAADILSAGQSPFALLHCVAGYPPDASDANLRAIRTLAERWRVPVGWSDHYRGDEHAIAAVALGATIVEKHVTLSRDNPDPDAPFALTPAEFQALATKTRRIFAGLGDGTKACRPSEANGLRFGRRGIFAARDLRAGEPITREMLKVVRPALGELTGDQLDAVVGKILAQDVKAWQPLDVASILRG